MLQRVDTKVITIFLWVLLLFGIIIARVGYLQLWLRPALAMQGTKNFLRIESKMPLRGIITDMHGIQLATNRPVIDLYWHGTGARTLKQNQLHTVERLIAILGLTEEQGIALHQHIASAENRYKKTVIKSDLSFHQLSCLEEQMPFDKNIQLDTGFKRFYPYKNNASHVLGYLGNLTVGHTGKMGLEKKLEEDLKGLPGTVARTVNSFGRSLEETALQESFNGNTIKTTLDMMLQMIAEEVFPPDQAGTCIIMDPEDGAILALVSRPSFDPNLFLDPISVQDWQALQENQPFINRACSALYPPGSIFKLITMSAALETNVITPETTVRCNGYIQFAQRRYWCHCKYGHGLLNVMDALAQSCNILCFKLGKIMDVDMFAHYAHLFGLGTPTNITIDEKAGLVPTKAWKKEAKGEPWWQGETLSVSIGQSFLLVTPLQVACMIGSIFTGSLVKPRIIATEAVEKRPLLIQDATRLFLQESMQAVVDHGTGQRVNKLRDITIYGKTSTTQTSALEKRDMGKKYMEHGWFVSHFRYKDHKPLVMVMLLENVGSSKEATMVAKNFLIKYVQEMRR